MVFPVRQASVLLRSDLALKGAHRRELRASRQSRGGREPGPALHGMHDYSQVDRSGLRYESINFSANTNLADRIGEPKMTDAEL